MFSKCWNFFIDNIFVWCGGHVFQQAVHIPMETNCAPLLDDPFLNSYEADFIADLIRKEEHCLARSFNLSFHYTDAGFSMTSFYTALRHVFKFVSHIANRQCMSQLLAYQSPITVCVFVCQHYFWGVNVSGSETRV